MRYPPASSLEGRGIIQFVAAVMLCMAIWRPAYGQLDAVDIPVMGAAGSGHAQGGVADPGATSHASPYWWADNATWEPQTAITSLGTVTVGTWGASTISVPYGGTGASTLTSHGVLVGEGTGTVAPTPAGGSGAVLLGQGSTADPLFEAMSGGASITNLGVVTLGYPGASTLGGVESYSPVTNQWLTGISTSGVPSSSQPSFSNLSGSVAASQLPNPGASSLGGIESYAAVTNQFLTGISTSGVPSSSQPSFSNISGSVAASQLPLATTSARGAVIPDGSTVDVSSGTISVPTATTSALGLVKPDGSSITISGGVISATDLSAFPAYSPGVSYTAGQAVLGTDGNVYLCISAASGTSPGTSADNGTYWAPLIITSALTLNCGAGQRFAGTSTDPAGINQCLTYLAHVASCSGAVTIQIAADPTGTVETSSGTTTTSFKSNTYFPVTTVMLFTGGTSANIGKSCAVTAVSGSSAPYTYTVSNTYGTTGLSSAPALGDAFTASYGYNTNGITITVPPVVAQNLTIVGSASTQVMPTFYPSVEGGGEGAYTGTYYVAVTYTWSDASGTTRETLPGPVTEITGMSTSLLEVTGFTLPTGVTGANLYAGTGTTLYKQGSFSVSSGVASNFDIGSYSTSTSAPTADPVAPAYPVALTFGNSGSLFTDTASGNVTINGLFEQAVSGSISGFVSGIAGGATTMPSTLTVGPSVVVKGFGNGVAVQQGSMATATGVQVDSDVYGIISKGGSVTATSALAIDCSTDGLLATNHGSIVAAGAYVGSSATGFAASEGGWLQVIQSATGADPTYATTTGYSQTSNVTGTTGGWISTE